MINHSPGTAHSRPTVHVAAPPAARPQQPGKEVPCIKGWRRAAYLGIAGGFFTLAAVGVVLPGLPTTPFLICSSYFLVRSSRRWNQRLLDSRLFGPLLLDWQERRGVRRDVKVKVILAVVITVGLTICISDRTSWLAAIIAGLALCGIVIIVRLPTVEDSSS